MEKKNLWESEEEKYFQEKQEKLGKIRVCLH